MKIKLIGVGAAGNKAVIEAVIASVEATVEEIALKGADQLYNALGLNEDSFSNLPNISRGQFNPKNCRGESGSGR